MRRNPAWALAWALGATLALWATAAAAQAPGASNPVEILGRLPSVEQVTVSPAGGRLAFIQTNGDARRLVVWSTAERKLVTAVDIGTEKIRDMDWADEDRLLLTSSMTATPAGFAGGKREWFMVKSCDVVARACKSFQMDIRDTETLNVAYGPPIIRRVDGRTVVFLHGGYISGGSVLLGLFSIDLERNRARLVARGTSYADGWLVDSRGGIAAVLEYRESRQSYRLRLHHPETGAWLDVDSQVAETTLEIPDVVGFGRDDDSVILRFADVEGVSYRAVSRRDGQWSKPFGGADVETLEGVLTDRLTSRVIGFHDASSARYTFVDPAMTTRWSAIQSAAKSARVGVVSWNDDASALVVLVDDPEVGHSYQISRSGDARSTPVGEVYRGLGPYSRRREIHYQAADGREIQAFLTMPREGRKPMALVVLPHGGPAVEDTADFDWWSQALAARGYAVLQPNFRGSSTTVEHLEAGFGEWGRKMQTDLSDGVRYLARQGIVDPARVCIVGASYGGYAALAGAAIDTGVYRCAVSVAGISHLPRMLDWENAEAGRGDSRSQRWWRRFMGATSPKDAALIPISPALRADAVTIPVLLIHGKDDTVVPYEQSEFMYKALRKLDRPVEFVTLKNEDHWLSRSETRLQMLQTSIAFLEKHNPP